MCWARLSRQIGIPKQYSTAPHNRERGIISAGQVRSEWQMTQPDDTKCALVIGAHPDDNEFGAGGTTAKLASQGWDITFIILTNGNKGSHDHEMSPYT